MLCCGSIVERQTLFRGVAPVDAAFDILLSGDEGGLGKFLVVARDFNLLAVLRNFLQSIVDRSEFLEFLSRSCFISPAIWLARLAMMTTVS